MLVYLWFISVSSPPITLLSRIRNSELLVTVVKQRPAAQTKAPKNIIFSVSMKGFGATNFLADIGQYLVSLFIFIPIEDL
jgi:hypothetical protein